MKATTGLVEQFSPFHLHSRKMISIRYKSRQNTNSTFAHEQKL